MRARDPNPLPRDPNPLPPQCTLQRVRAPPGSPGLPDLLLSAAGTDATDAFRTAGHSRNAHRILARFACPLLDECDANIRRHALELATLAARPLRTPPWRGRRGAFFEDDERAEPTPWRAAARMALGVMTDLASSAQGRRQLFSSASALLSAALTDMERVGRDPREGDVIQRHLPVVWRATCAECGALARLLRQPRLVEGEASGGSTWGADDAFAALEYAR